VKIYPVLFILYWVLKRRFRPAVTATVAFLGGAAVLSLCGFGWRGSIEAHRIWLGQLRGIESPQVHRGGRGLGVGGQALETPAASVGVWRPLLPSGDIPFSEGRNEYHRYNNQSLAVVVRRLTTALYPAGDPHRVNLLDLSPRASAWVYGMLAGGLLAGLAILAWRRRGRCDLEEWAAWLAAVIAFVPIYWTHYFVLALPVLTIMSFRVWQGRQTGRPERAATILQACWLVGLVLLAVPAAREVGVHCWIVLATALWAVLRLERGATDGGIRAASACGKPGV
ncbi:MAG TPA: glycosyltransferase 87 family protein, partial [Phycisphaerae bacterium]|nr:glycosyltransferase 87 family protein [Phycisphaerae bacterium]